MLVREYRNLDRTQWHDVFVHHHLCASAASDDYCFMGHLIWRNKNYMLDFHAERNNAVALDRALTACGEARRYEVEPAVSAAAISDMKTWFGIEDDTKEILDSMLADLDQWARDSEAEARAIAEAEAAVVEEPKKKSFFKRFFSK